MEAHTDTINFCGKNIPWEYVKDPDRAAQILQELMAQDVLFGIDTETAPVEEFYDHPKAGLSPHLSRIRLLQLYDGENSYVFDMDHVGLHLLCGDLIEFLETKRFIAHNAIFDLKFFMRLGVRHMNIACTRILYKLISHAVYPTDSGLSASLDGLSNAVLKTPISKKVQVSNWNDPDLTFEQVEYSALDPVACYMIAEKIGKGLSKFGLEEVYKLTKEAQYPLAEMQLNGLCLDIEKHQAMIHVWRDELYSAKKELMSFLGSTEIKDSIVRTWLEKNLDEYTLMIWPRTEGGENNKNEQLSVSAHTFVEFSYLPIVAPLARYKKLEKLSSTYGDTLLNLINPATGKLHADYNLCGARTGRLSSSRPNLQQCFSGDTEILTEKGWTRFDQLETFELYPNVRWKVAQYNDYEGDISFVHATRFVKQKFTGKLVHNHSTQIDLLTTPDHQCLLFSRKNIAEKVLAENLISDRKQRHAGDYFQVKEEFYSDDFIRLLVATQADGSFTVSNKIDFSFSKIRKKNRFEKLIYKLGIRFTTSHRVDTKYSTGYRYRYLLEDSLYVREIFKLLPNKTFQWNFIFGLSYRQLNVFCDEIKHWDGLFERGSNYGSVIEQNCDIVQTAFALTNRRARKRVYTWNEERGTGSKNYQVDIALKRNHSWTTNCKKELIDYDDFVYCVTVPKGNIVVRRNGKICITGNCPNDKEFRSHFIPSPGNIFVCADYSQIEVRIAAEISGDEEMLSIYRQGLDIYSATAAHLTNRSIHEIRKDSVERKVAKALVLGLLFGLGAEKFSHYAKKGYGIDISYSDALANIKKFREVYPGLRAWQIEQSKTCGIELKAVTVGGKVRKLASDNYYGPGLNMPIQGTAAEIVLRSLNNIYCYTRETPVKLVNCVHDENLLECPPEMADDTVNLVEWCMVDAFKQSFPNGITNKLVNIWVGENWGAGKG